MKPQFKKSFPSDQIEQKDIIDRIRSLKDSQKQELSGKVFYFLFEYSRNNMDRLSNEELGFIFRKMIPLTKDPFEYYPLNANEAEESTDYALKLVDSEFMQKKFHYEPTIEQIQKGLASNYFARTTLERFLKEESSPAMAILKSCVADIIKYQIILDYIPFSEGDEKGDWPYTVLKCGADFLTRPDADFAMEYAEMHNLAVQCCGIDNGPARFTIFDKVQSFLKPFELKLTKNNLYLLSGIITSAMHIDLRKGDYNNDPSKTNTFSDYLIGNVKRAVQSSKIKPDTKHE